MLSVREGRYDQKPCLRKDCLSPITFNMRAKHYPTTLKNHISPLQQWSTNTGYFPTISLNMVTALQSNNNYFSSYILALRYFNLVNVELKYCIIIIINKFNNLIIINNWVISGFCRSVLVFLVIKYIYKNIFKKLTMTFLTKKKWCQQHLHISLQHFA